MIGKNAESSNKGSTKNPRFEYKDEDIFVIEDESQVTMENNNMPNTKIDAMEIGSRKIELARQQLSNPTGPFEQNPDHEIDEESHGVGLNASHFSSVPNHNLQMDTERDAI